jgi:hypothetical protein
MAELLNYQESHTKGNNPDIVIKQMFSIAHTSYFRYLLDHNGKDKNVTDIHNDHDIVQEKIAADKFDEKGYGSYLEYAGRADVTTLEEGVDAELLPTFTQDALNITKEQGKQIERQLEEAAERKNILWKTVVAFSDGFLIEQGIMDNAESRKIDQVRIKKMLQEQMPKMLADEGLSDSAKWFGAIHMYGTQNDKHIHVHLSTYEVGKSNRPNVFNKETFRLEPKGTFKQKTLDTFKSRIWRSLLPDEQREKELGIFMERTKFRDNLLTKISEVDFQLQKEATLNALLHVLPNDETKWRAGSNSAEMRAAHGLAHEFVDMVIENEAPGDFEAFVATNTQLQALYEKGYGDNDKTNEYAENRIQELKNQLINRLYAEIKQFDVDDVKVSMKSTIESQLPEENERIKDRLQESVDLMRSKGMAVPKNVTKELGLRKYIIKNQNIRARQAVIDNHLSRIGQYQEASDLLDAVHDRLVVEKNVNNLMLKKKWELTDQEKTTMTNTKKELVDVHQLSPDKFTDEMVSRLTTERQHLIELTSKADDSEIVAAYGDEFTIAEQRQYQLELLNNEVEIIEQKGQIHHNNKKISNGGITSEEARLLKRDNANRFGRIAELEGRENTFVLNEGKKAQRIRIMAIKRVGQQRFSGYNGTQHAMRRSVSTLVSAMRYSNHEQQQALSAYEEDQQRLQQALEQQTQEF